MVGRESEESVTMIGKKGKNTPQIDPLYQLFERSLVNRSYDDSAAFTKQLAEQYMAYLDSTPAHVPFTVRQSLLEDLCAEAHEMLVKKMYGCERLQDYQNTGAVLKIDRRQNQLAPVDLLELLQSDTGNPTENK